MDEVKLYKLLKLMGYATLVGFVVSNVTTSMLRMQRAKAFGISDELVNDTLAMYFIGAVIESPLYLPTGLLCLFAAYHLNQNLKPVSEIFE